MANNKGWAGVQGFFNGLAGVTNSVGDIFDTGADIAEDIARGKGALADQRNDLAIQKLDKKEREQDIFLKGLKVQRGDNVVLYWAAAFAATLGIILIAKG